jgi:thioredoxin 1
MAKNGKYVKLTDQNFRSEVLDSSKPVLVDFWADWCAPCHRMAPAIEELAAEFDGRATIGKVNVDEQTGLAQEYGIRSIPALVFFQDGKVVQRVNGVVPKRTLVSELESLLAAA